MTFILNSKIDSTWLKVSVVFFRELFFTVMEDGKSKVTMSTDPVSGEDPLLGFQVATSLLCRSKLSHYIFLKGN